MMTRYSRCVLSLNTSASFTLSTE